jgi:hypothetical protein
MHLLFADVGIPMIFIQWPLMLAALIPVILIEAIIVRRWLPLSYRAALLGAGKAKSILHCGRHSSGMGHHVPPRYCSDASTRNGSIEVRLAA